MEKKDRILDVAENLFSEYGYNGISMREIADALDMSVGNLTYHYKKKVDLIIAVVVRQHEGYVLKEPVTSIDELVVMVKGILEYTRSKGYYFRNYKHFSLVSEQIRVIQSRTMNDLYSLFLETFKNLATKKLLRAEQLPEQYSNTVQTMLSILFYGLPKFEAVEPKMDNRAACLWTILYPLLTVDGVHAYKRIVAEQQTDKGEKHD